ncbi:TAXI family TRAP transporter solute-binding subunit [Geopsychrobacter electrodiphilus]|uniref:TAXI family TRAP transporter solute-binding subunit n=1 Tax=Geopsychrobacter electrodiphilus TaxID=225196 RepID=UPI000367BC10|nr:TAXI family TRAP transporter solute-binding subunit [Geopsychrobacter electrodiphilus]
MKRTALFPMVLALMLSLSICLTPSSSFAADKGKIDTSMITFGAATVGGFWYVLAGAYGDAIHKYNKTVVNVIQGGSIANIKGLEQGVFQMGFSNGQTVPEALEGKAAFAGKPVTTFDTIAGLYSNVFFIAVSGDSDIKTIKDLKGKSVSPGIKGYSGELAFQSILKANGLSYDDLSNVQYVGTADGASLLRDGHIDALLGMLNQPNSSLQELDTTLRSGIRLIPLDLATVRALQSQNKGYANFTIKGGTYKSEQRDTPTVAAVTQVLVLKDLPEQFVYDVTKVLIENEKTWRQLSKTMKDFDGKMALSSAIGPMHPGAVKYYKEAGLL